MHSTRHRLLLVLLLAMLGATNVAMAQSEAESASGAIELQSNSGGQQRTFRTGSKVSVKYTVDPRVFPDLTLEQVMDSSVVLSGDTVGIEYVDRIQVRDEKQFRKGVGFIIAALAAIVLMIAAIAMLASSLVSGSAILTLAIVLVGILSIPNLFSFPALIIGIVLAATATTTYRIWTHWKPILRPGK